MNESTLPTPIAPDAGAATLVSPVDDELIDALASTFEWTPVAGAGSYRLQIASDEDFASLHVDADVGPSTQVTMYDLLPLARGRLHWRIQAQVRGDWVTSPSESFRAALDYTERSRPARAATAAPAPGSEAPAAATAAHAGAPAGPGTDAPVITDTSSAMNLVWIWVALTVAAAALVILKVLFSGA